VEESLKRDPEGFAVAWNLQLQSIFLVERIKHFT
jgi:hypothetical protein